MYKIVVASLVFAMLLAAPALATSSSVNVADIHSMGFDVVDISYNPATSLLRFAAQQRVMTVTYVNNTQVPVTGIDLILETYLNRDDTAAMGHPAAQFTGGSLIVTERDAITGASQILLKAAVREMFVEQSTYPSPSPSYAPNRLLTMMGAYQLTDPSDPQYGVWNGLLPQEGNIFTLAWQMHDVITDFSTPFTAAEDMQLIVVPEPATMTMVGLGALALLRRRRK
jgi:hypothetical protein